MSAILGLLPYFRPTGRGSALALAKDGLQACDVLAERAQPQGVLERLRGAPESETEPFFLELRDTRLDVVRSQLANFVSSHRALLLRPPLSHPRGRRTLS